MKRVGILNISGYAGAELARILHRHPQVELVSVTGRTAAGQSIGQVFPHLAGLNLTVEASLASDVEFVFSALPHAVSAEELIPYVRAGLPVVDLSADFRLRNAQEYATWYGGDHPAPDLLAEAVYGLSELNRRALTSATLVANPGCYPEGALLALAPAVMAGIVGPNLIIDSKSGLSGAGRTLSLKTHFSEVNDSVSAYGLDGHRHLPEIVQELAGIWPATDESGSVMPNVTFTPHLIPMTRGILSTCYAELLDGHLPGEKEASVREIYRDFYKDEPFVRVMDVSPASKQIWGSNLCLVYPTVDSRTGRLVVVSVIDNLVKGASGQAVQNMNLMLGFPETLGLEAPSVYP